MVAGTTGEIWPESYIVEPHPAKVHELPSTMKGLKVNAKEATYIRIQELEASNDVMTPHTHITVKIL